MNFNFYGNARRGRPAQAASEARQLVIPCSSAANATVREGVDGRRSLIISGELNDSDGTSIGTFSAVYGADIFSKSDLTDYPCPPERPFDRPFHIGETVWTPMLNPIKSEWIFQQPDQWITGWGQALIRIATKPSGETTFWCSGSSFVHMRDGGEPIAVGEAASLGTASFPLPPAPVDGISFPIVFQHLISIASNR